MKNSHLLKKIQDTRYKKHCTWDNYASVPFKVMTLRKSGSLVAVWIKSLATAAQCSVCCGSRSSGVNFAVTHFMPKSCVKISDTVVFRIPRSATGSHTVSRWSLLIAASTPLTFSGVLLVTGLPECGPLSTDSQPSFEVFVPHFYLHRTHGTIPRSLLDHLSSFCGGMFKLNAKFDADLLFYCFSHLNVTATQYSRSLSGVYCPHRLVQWSCQCSRGCALVHLLWLPGYISVM